MNINPNKNQNLSFGSLLVKTYLPQEKNPEMFAAWRLAKNQIADSFAASARTIEALGYTQYRNVQAGCGSGGWYSIFNGPPAVEKALSEHIKNNNPRPDFLAEVKIINSEKELEKEVKKAWEG